MKKVENLYKLTWSALVLFAMLSTVACTKGQYLDVQVKEAHAISAQEAEQDYETARDLDQVEDVTPTDLKLGNPTQRNGEGSFPPPPDGDE